MTATMEPPPTLEVFYSSTCAPCRLDLPSLAQFVRNQEGRLHIVILSDEARARDELRSVSPRLNEVATFAGVRAPREILRDAGDSDGILPFARAVGADKKVCASWRGRLTFERAKKLIAACQAFITSRSPQRP